MKTQIKSGSYGSGGSRGINIPRTNLSIQDRVKNLECLSNDELRKKESRLLLG